MGGIDYRQLLTDDEKRAFLHEAFGHRFTHQGKLQLPELNQYNQIHTNEGLQDTGIGICRWIGLRVSGMKIQFSDSAATFATDTKSKTILISSGLRKHPYSCAAILSLAILSYALEKSYKTKPNTPIIEFASVELGLGIWLINALRPDIKHSHKVHHIISTTWDQREFISLQNYSAESYVNSVIKFARDNRIAAEDYVPHIAKRCRHLLPDFIAGHSERHLPEPTITISHKKVARLFWAKIIISSLVLACSISLAIYIAAANHSVDTTAKQQQANTIESLRGEYNECQLEASRQQSSYDPNDLFMTRQVDATKARCESLRNQYNYAIDQYNATP